MIAEKASFGKYGKTFQEGLVKTVEWYLSEEKWLDQVTSGNYRQYYNSQYAKP